MSANGAWVVLAEDAERWAAAATAAERERTRELREIETLQGVAEQLPPFQTHERGAAEQSAAADFIESRFLSPDSPEGNA